MRVPSSDRSARRACGCRGSWTGLRVPWWRSLAAHGAFEHVGAASPLDLTGVALHRDRIPRWNGRDVSVVLPPVPLNVRAHLSPFGAAPAAGVRARTPSPLHGGQSPMS